MQNSITPAYIGQQLTKDDTIYRRSFLWSWVGLCLPSLYWKLLIDSVTIKVSDKVVSYGVGILTKRFRNIDLYQVHSVAAEESWFTGGKLAFKMMDGTTHTIEHVANAGYVSSLFRGLIDDQRADQRMFIRETY